VSDDHFLSRWSRRKHLAKRDPSQLEKEEARPAQPAAAAPADASPPAARAEASPLPPVESLTPESDFTPFMKGDVDPDIKRQALRTLVRDPGFNVMDGLDTYIDDYSKPDPLPEGWLEKMTQVARLGDFHPAEPETEKVAESAPAAEEIPTKIEEEQPVAPTDVADSAPVRNKGKPDPEVGDA
jgi:uncharacterized protein DUF3306